MHSDNLNDAVEYLRAHPQTCFATVEDTMPWVRAMALARADDDGTLWYATWQASKKVQQIGKNPNVCVFVSDGNTFTRIFGTAQVIADAQLKHALWHESWTEYFAGEDDPNYVLIKVTPARVEMRR